LTNDGQGLYEMIQKAFDNIYEAVCICIVKESDFLNKGSEKLYGVSTEIMKTHKIFSNPYV
jgi:hypothetical protein